MSAIGGIHGFQGHKIDQNSLINMASVMQSRGQDTETYWQSKNIGFAHRQLFTTEESRYERQPLVLKGKGLSLTSDARIDNRNELLEKLICDDNKVVTDADLILASYEKWNENCVDYLIGDFAFAIWDMRVGKLFCARDHLGIKPFYYLQDEQYFYFASQISGLYSASGIDRKPNLSEIQNFLDEDVISCEATFFEAIKRLLPGHILTIRDKKIQTKRYWYPELIKIDETMNFDDAKRNIYELMQDAVKVRLRNTYNTGCEISGGLDSSIVLALAVRSSKDKNIIPFASTYGELSCDESSYIQAMAETLSVKPVIDTPDKFDYIDACSLDTYYQLAPDWPGSGSFLDNFGACQNAKERNVRVVLTGQGGDHVAAGNYLMLADFVRSWQLSKLYEQHRKCNLNYKTIKNYILVPLLPDPLKRFLSFVFGKSRNTFLSGKAFCFPLDAQATRSKMQIEELRWIIGKWNQLWMDINPYTAIGGHYNIEFRHPFFDKRVVEFMLSVPPWMKIDGNRDKVILREAMKKELASQVYKRCDKAEFTPIVRLQLEKSLENGSFDSIEIKGMCVNFKKSAYNYNGDNDYTNEVWKNMCIARWLRRNFDVEGGLLVV